MEVEIKIQDCSKPHAVIYTHEMTEEVKRSQTMLETIPIR